METTLLLVLLAGVQVSVEAAFQEVPSPDLSLRASKGFDAWRNPGPPYANTQEDTVDIIEARQDDLSTFKQQILAGEGSVSFLPGLGIIRDGVDPGLQEEPVILDNSIPFTFPDTTRSSLNVGPQNVIFTEDSSSIFIEDVINSNRLIEEISIEKSSSSVNGGRDNISASEAEIISPTSVTLADNFPPDVEIISPTSVTLADNSPPVALRREGGAEKCEYVQMKGGTIGDNCMKGGMSCSRKCSFDMSEPVCTQVSTTVCEDVAVEKCETVADKSCKTVQEEVCEDPTNPTSMKECEVVVEENCLTVVEDICRNTTKMECTAVDKEACTTLKEQVCRPFTEEKCRKKTETTCSLLQDVVCRNVTESRFEEKCWTIEEEVCKTVYDTVWENKCEMVNITVPQKDCEVKETFKMEQSCEIVNETVSIPVCINVQQQIADEICEDVEDSEDCFAESCSEVQVPFFRKDCREVPEESCEVVIEQSMDKKCSDIEQKEYSEECTTIEEQVCTPKEELVCEEVKAPSTGYGVPQADVISLTSTQLPRTPKKVGDLFGARPGSRWRRKSILSRTLKEDNNTTVEDDTRRRRSADPSADEENDENDITSASPTSKVFERSTNWENHPPTPLIGVGSVFQKFGPSEYTANYYGQTPAYTSTTSVAPNTPACSYVTKEECVSQPKTTCTQVPQTTVKSVCVDFPISTPRQECNQTVRQLCDVIEENKSERRCEVSKTARALRKVCRSSIRMETREECKNVEVSQPKQLCTMVPRTEQQIACNTLMKPLELKELCIDIDIQLPREECSKETREECRFEPTVGTIQRCEPTIREDCRETEVDECGAECTERCEEQERRMCMTIPQQQCQETLVQQCDKVPREECKTVPREECRIAEKPARQGECRLNTRLDCTDVPRERCGKTFTSVCKQVPQQKCTDRKTENCAMECDPVVWCKICS